MVNKADYREVTVCWYDLEA